VPENRDVLFERNQKMEKKLVLLPVASLIENAWARFGPPNPDRLFDVPMAGLIPSPFLSSH
jgi:hypothetical protein